MRVDYLLAETIVTVTGTVSVTTDDVRGPDVRSTDDVTVVMGVRGDEGNGTRWLDFGSGKADLDFSVSLTSDRRITGLSYKGTGVGGRVVKATGTLVAFVSGIAARLSFAAPGVQESSDPVQQKWAARHADLARLQGEYAALVPSLEDKLLEARTAAANAESPTEQSLAMARARRVHRLLDDVRGELARIDDLFRAWRATTLTTRQERIVHTISVDALPRGEAGAKPQPGDLNGTARAVWEDLGVIVQVEPADARVIGAPHHQPPEGDEQEESRLLRWRVPRPVRLTVWRRGKNDVPVLERSHPATIVDRRCSTVGVPLTASLFGGTSAEVAFDADGVPTKVASTSTSGWAEFAEALGGVPEAVASGLDSVTKAQASVTGLLDARAERRAAAVKREYEQLQNELNLKGLNATADDVARLKRLEQRVAIAEAEGSLAGPSEVDELEAELREVKARTELSAARREEALEYELSDLRAEVARLQVQLERAEARTDANLAAD